jgi:hypothetical protein
MPALTASLEIITSPLLGEVRHGFFTRRGGASSGIFEGLNCGNGSSDQSAVVATNRDRVARAMDVPAGPAGHRPPGPHRPRRHAVGPRDGADHRRRHRHGHPGPGHRDPDRRLPAGPLQRPRRGRGRSRPCRLARRARRHPRSHARSRWRPPARGARMCTPSSAPAISQRAYEVGRGVPRTLHGRRRRTTRGSSSTGRTANTCSTCPATASSGCATRAWAQAEWTRHCTYTDAARFYSYRRSVHRGRPITAA